MKIAIIGGTGKLGLAFVARLQPTQHEAAIGSRDVAKAQEAAATSGMRVKPMSNVDAAAWCDIAIVSVPYAAHRAIIEPLKTGLQGKIVIDPTVPLNPANLFRSITESGTSAAEETNSLLDGAHVFGAFHTISHRILRRQDHSEDVFVAGNEERKKDVLTLIQDMNLRPIDVGPLAAAHLLECLTPLLISINKQNGIKEAGFKVTGIR